MPDMGLAAFHTWFTPSPVLSPGLVSLIQLYKGLLMAAHCFAPSSRTTML